MKTRIVVLFDLGLVVAGLLLVLYFVALLAWQISSLFQAGSWVALPATLLFSEHSFAFVPEFPWAAPKALAWVLERMHLGLVFAVPGSAVMALGALGALRQMALIRARKQRNEDRLRRVRDYRRDESRADTVDGRREPFIGSGGSARNADRRVA